MLRIGCLKILQAIRPFTMQKRTKTALSRTWFHFLFHENLLLTNSLTSGLFMAVGDLVIQEFEFRNGLIPGRYNWARATRMLIVGGMLGPMHHYYYIKLDQLIPKVNLKTVFIKIAADQFVCAPLTILFFFYGMGVLESKNLEEISNEIKLKFKYVYMGDCIFWPPVQFINFYYLPTPYRVVYINLATVIFDIYLAFVKHYDSGHTATIDHVQHYDSVDTTNNDHIKHYDSKNTSNSNHVKHDDSGGTTNNDQVKHDSVDTINNDQVRHDSVDTNNNDQVKHDSVDTINKDHPK